MLPCKMAERGWTGYVIDVMTMGGYTTYRTFEYTQCVQKLRDEDYLKVVKAFSATFPRETIHSTKIQILAKIPSQPSQLLTTPKN